MAARTARAARAGEVISPTAQMARFAELVTTGAIRNSWLRRSKRWLGCPDPSTELQKLGGARVILATASSGKSMSALVGGLEANGTMVVVGASMEPIEVAPNQLIFGRKRIQGWSAGIPTDSEDTLRFAEMTGVRPMIEKYPLAKAAEGYARMMSGKAEFRVVLTM